MTAHLADWIPIRTYWQDARLMVEWCRIGERRFTEPFWDQSVDACLRHPFNQLFRHQTPIDALVELHAQRPGLPPKGFVFHLSRCGSTLITQLLTTLPGTVVLSEAGPIDAVLRAAAHDPAITDEQRCHWLRGMVSALGQPRFGDERALVIKFDSWSLLDLPVIHRAFPEVPWVFVFRDPVEVLESHRRERGSQMVPSIVDPRVFGFDRDVLRDLSLDDYAAHVLARICEAALTHLSTGRAALIHYPQLPEIVWSALLPFFGLPSTTSDPQTMRAAARFHAKRPGQPFAGDTHTKQRAASLQLRAAAERWVGPLYEQLLALLPTYGLRA